MRTPVSFPDRNVKGDPSLLAAISRRSPSLAGGSSAQLPTGLSMIPRRLKPSGAPAAQLPFELSVAKEADDWKWTVSSVYSCITDGTNGAVIDLSTAGFDGGGTIVTAEKYVVLEADIDEVTGDITDWILSAVDEAEAIEEVGTDESAVVTGTIFQNKIRLLIGKLAYDAGPPVSFEAIQAAKTAQILVDGLTNGLPCKVLANHLIHPTAL